MVKQGTTYGTIMCCVSTAIVNATGEKVICKYGNIEIGMSVFKYDIAVIGDAETTRKGEKNTEKWK